MEGQAQSSMRASSPGFTQPESSIIHTHPFSDSGLTPLQTYKHCVPPDLKRRLFLYLDYNQQYNHEVNVMEEMLAGMPKQVRTAVKLATTQDLIRKVRLFRDTSPNFISAGEDESAQSQHLNGNR